LSSHAPAFGAAVANASAVTDASGGECSDLLGIICDQIVTDIGLWTLDIFHTPIQFETPLTTIPLR
jgi:hypothetical protein